LQRFRCWTRDLAKQNANDSEESFARRRKFDRSGDVATETGRQNRQRDNTESEIQVTMSGDRSTPLYLLPGLICDETVWAEQVRSLADFQPAAISGYGNARSLARMAAQVLESAPERISLAGHSMGARVALEMYRLAPERIERLALLDTGVHPLAPGETEKRMALFELGQNEGMEVLVDAWLPPMVHPDRRNDRAFMQPLTEMCLRAGLEQFENQMIALLERPDVRSLLAEISCPTLVGVGSDDAWSPVKQHREIAAAVPDATLVIFEHSGHMSPVETPEPVSDALRQWLERPLLQ
jgi:pimeloyl-ACP methyl ester carboxylesterase